MIVAATGQLIADHLSALATTDGTPVKGYLWEPASLDSCPAGVVELPQITRVPADQGETQLGTRDFTLTFPVALYFDLTESAYCQAQAIDIAEKFVNAIDADPGLGGAPGVIDCKVYDTGPPQYLQDAPRPLIYYPCVVEVFRLTT